MKSSPLEPEIGLRALPQFVCILKPHHQALCSREGLDLKLLRISTASDKAIFEKFVYIRLYEEDGNMYKRKIMKLGRSSLVVSLPKDWIRTTQSKQGDMLSMNAQKDGSLLVFPGIEKKKVKREITLQVDPAEKTPSLCRKIIACYLNGYSIIRLVSRDIFTVAQQKAIRDIVRVLYMRIMESTARTTRIQTLIDESSASIETAVRRMHIISSSMAHDALGALGNHDVQLAKVVYSLDDDVDHFSFFLLRLLRSCILDPVLAGQLDIDPLDCLDYQTLVHRIEHVADHAANISKQLIILEGRDQKLGGSTLELIIIMGNEALSAYNAAVKSFFSKDEELSNDVIDRQNKVEVLDQKVASGFVEETNALKVCVTCSIRDSIRRISEYAADIAEITINHAYKPSK